MAIANVVLQDATTPTPVSHTFVPIQDGANAKYVNESAQTLKGQETLQFNAMKSSDGKQASKASITMWDPTEVAGVAGVYEVAYGSSADLRFNFAPQATLLERQNLVRMAKNAITAFEADLAYVRPQI